MGRRPPDPACTPARAAASWRRSDG
jgi:hypothetical protein